MSATLDDVTKKIKPEPSAEQAAAVELVRRAREQGLSLTGPDGLLKQLTKTVLETALNEELTEHLGHEKVIQELNRLREQNCDRTVDSPPLPSLSGQQEPREPSTRFP